MSCPECGCAAWGDCEKSHDRAWDSGFDSARALVARDLRRYGRLVDPAKKQRVIEELVKWASSPRGVGVS